MRGLIGEMLNAGLHPILAHPERYKYMEQSDYEELKQLGLLFHQPRLHCRMLQQAHQRKG